MPAQCELFTPLARPSSCSFSHARTLARHCLSPLYRTTVEQVTTVLTRSEIWGTLAQ